LMGGQMTVHSTVGQGTTFTITLPVPLATVSDLDLNQPVRRVIGLAPNQPRYRLLIVDDIADTRALLVKLLSPFDFAMREATNGQDAVAIWQTWQPQLIWMDLRMPVMDGYEAVKRIRNEELRMKNDTPPGNSSFLIPHSSFQTVIIALTASAFDEEREMVLAAGCDDFLGKPFRETEIFAVLHKHLGVQFVYADVPDKAAKDVASAAEVTVLPPALRDQLAQTAREHDIARMDRLMQQLQRDYPAVAERLSEFADALEYEQILRLLQTS
jgi:CheY-like chemotaxis protein